MTEKEKMLSGMLYDPADRELSTLRAKAHRLSAEYNATYETEETRRREILRELIPDQGAGVYLQGPVQFDYGCFTSIGDNTYANFNFTCLDCCPVHIGSNVFFGPNVSILTPMHPLRWQERNLYRREDGVMTDREYARPITIEDNSRRRNRGRRSLPGDPGDHGRRHDVNEKKSGPPAVPEALSFSYVGA